MLFINGPTLSLSLAYNHHNIDILPRQVAYGRPLCQQDLSAPEATVAPGPAQKSHDQDNDRGIFIVIIIFFIVINTTMFIIAVILVQQHGPPQPVACLTL